MNKNVKNPLPFAEGEDVIHKKHGVGTIEKIATEEVHGINGLYIAVALQDGGTVKIPAALARGVLKVIDESFPAEEIIEILCSKPEKAPKGNWRNKHTSWAKKVNSGNLKEVARVVCDLAPRSLTVCYSQRNLFGAACTRVINAFAVHWNCSVEDATRKLNEALAEAGLELEYSGVSTVSTQTRKRPGRKNQGSMPQKSDVAEEAELKNVTEPDMQLVRVQDELRQAQRALERSEQQIEGLQRELAAAHVARKEAVDKLHKADERRRAERQELLSAAAKTEQRSGENQANLRGQIKGLENQVDDLRLQIEAKDTELEQYVEEFLTVVKEIRHDLLGRLEKTSVERRRLADAVVDRDAQIATLKQQLRDL